MLGTVADLEMKFYGNLGYTGSLTDRRRAYWFATEGIDRSRSTADMARAFWANNAIEASTANNTDLERREYDGGGIVFGPSNSVSDLRYEKFGGLA